MEWNQRRRQVLDGRRLLPPPHPRARGLLGRADDPGADGDGDGQRTFGVAPDECRYADLRRDCQLRGLRR
jgi:hypothetical protein